MFSEVIALQFIGSFLPNVLFYIETIVVSRDAGLNAQEAFRFIFADKDSD